MIASRLSRSVSRNRLFVFDSSTNHWISSFLAQLPSLASPPFELLLARL